MTAPAINLKEENHTSIPVTVRIQQLPHGQDLPLPTYATAQSAGMDLYAAVDGDVVIASGERKAIPAGIIIALPQGFEAQIRSRSGLAVKHGITVLNAPGTIDSDYRGEIIAILINHGSEPFTITRGMRCAQMVISPVTTAVLSQQAFIDDAETERGMGKFGSTGY